MIAIVGTNTEEARAEHRIVKQKAAKVGRERLYTDTDAVEVEVRRYVSQVAIDESGLQTDGGVVAHLRRIRGRAQQPALIRRDSSHVEGRREAKLPIGRLESGVALVQDGFERKGLRPDFRLRATESIERIGPFSDRPTNRQRERARLEERIGDTDEGEIPIFAKHRTITFQSVMTMVGIE